MLRLTEAQYEALRGRDADQFVRAVCDQYLGERPEIAGSLATSVVYQRMLRAFDFGRRLGLQSTPHMIRLMYLASDAPGFQDDTAVSAHLRRTGVSPEQRLDDLLAVMDHKLKGMN